MKAERLYIDVIKRLIGKGTSADDNSIIEISLKLARIYGEWRKDEKAVAGYKHCIKTQEEKMKSGKIFNLDDS